MKIETLKERIAKKEAQIAKKHNTIEKKQKQIAKKEAEVVKMGYDPNGDKYQAYETEDHAEVYWTMCEIEGLKSDIIRNEHEIEEAGKTLEKYEAQLAGEIEKEATFIKEVPEQVKDMEQMLISEWDRYDKDHRDRMRKAYNEMGYREFVKKYGFNRYGTMQETDEEIHNRNTRDARRFVLDFLNRTKHITGEVTTWSGVYLETGTHGFPVLNGYVEGKEGRAVVESILAGGYNIQRLHVRVLVKAC